MQVLNGAQVQSMVEVITQVSAGIIPRSTAIAIMVSALGIDSASADKIMGDVGTEKFKPPPPPSNTFSPSGFNQK